MNTMTRTFALALGAAVLAAAPLAAQHSHHGNHAQHGAQAQQHAGHAGHQAAAGEHPVLHAALMHRAELSLTADQVARLEAIRTAARAAHREACQRMHAPGGGASADHQAQHTAMQAAMHRTHEEAASVLTAEQRTRLQALHAAHQAAGGHAGHHAAAGQHAAHAQHAAAQGEDCCAGDGCCCCEGGQQAKSDCCEKCCKDGKCDEAACAECCEEGGCGEHGEGHGASHTQAAHNH